VNGISFPAPTRAALRAALSLLFTLSLVTPGLAAGQRAKSPQKRRTSASRSRAARPARESAPRAPQEAQPAGLLQAPSQEHEAESDDADKRENWFYYERAYPFGEIPADARRLAWESRPGREKGRAQTLSQGVWSPIGPAPTEGFASAQNWGVTSGRINAVAVHPTNPNVVLVGAATGGIWRSADGGATFAPVSDSQVDLAVGAIAFAPSNPSVVYAGMGDIDNTYVGSGILKSTDAGLTWARVGNPSPVPQSFVTDIAVDPANPDRVYVTVDLVLMPNGAATTGYAFQAGGFYVSANGGGTWQRTLPCRARNLALHPTNPQIIYAAARVMDPPTTGGTPGIFKSTDAGQTWGLVYASPYYDPARPTILFTRDIQVATTKAPGASEYVYVYAGRTTRMTTDTSEPLRELRVELSTDGGATWSARGAGGFANVDTSQFGYNTYIKVSPSNAATVYIGARDIYKTTNGDQASPTWTNITKNYNASFQYNPFNSNTHSDQQTLTFAPGGDGSTIYIGNDGGISKSTDGGATFSSLNQTLSLTQFVHLSLHPTDPNISYGGAQDNGTQRRLEGTSRWKEFSSGDGGFSIINPADPSMVFTTYVYGRVNRHVSNGATFSGTIANTDTFGETEANNATPRISFYPPVVGNGVDHRIYFGSWKLFVCNDCNDTTKRIGGGSTPPTWVSPAPNTDLTKGNGDVLEAIAVARSNTNVIYTGSRQGCAKVSTDGGATWAPDAPNQCLATNQLPNRTITSITVNPSNPATAYLTVSGYGSGHVFKTTSTGASWTDISANLPNIPVNAFLIDPLAPATFYVGTDVGVFRSTDGGASWETFNAGMPPVVVTAFAAQAGGRIQAATYGRGAYELSLVPDSVIQFSAAGATVSESAGRATLTVTRTGSAAGASTVDYQTADADTFTVGCADKAGAQGNAYARCDFATTVGTISFAPNETSKTVTVPIIDDGHVEDPETFQLRLANASGATLGAFNATTVTIQDNDSGSVQNPVNHTPHDFFVRQQYLDFLSREPDAGGFNAWLGVLNTCLPDAFTGPAVQSGCDRIFVSGEGFFRSPEFALKGAYAFRLYKVAFNRLPEYLEIVSDMSFVAGATPQEVYARRAELALRFTQRQEFANSYGGMTNQQYVAALLGRYGLTSVTTPDPASPDTGQKVTLTSADLVNRLNGVGGTLTRAQVLRAVVDSDQVGAAEFNNAFVAMQYYGYLRRKPEPSGYAAWLAVLQSGDVRTMVNGFLNSAEYKLRFGQP
jgi:hypothetical protein